MGTPTVSYVVPARNEAAYLDATLESIRAQATTRSFDIVVADGESADATPVIARDHGATVVVGDDAGIWAGRNRGAAHAAGEWLAFVDADTTVAPNHLETMLEYAREHDLDALSSRCHIPAWRGKPMQFVVNRVFPRLTRPVLPGFNFFVRRSVFEETGGFPSTANEDTAYSRRLAREYDTGYVPETLVETSPRRIREQGLTGMTYHYLRLDWQRLRSKR